MTPTVRLCGLLGLMLALALPAGCRRRLPRPGKPIAAHSTHHTSAPPLAPPGRARP